MHRNLQSVFGKIEVCGLRGYTSWRGEERKMLGMLCCQVARSEICLFAVCCQQPSSSTSSGGPSLAAVATSSSSDSEENDDVGRLQSKISELTLQLSIVSSERDSLVARVAELEHKIQCLKSRSRETAIDRCRQESPVIGRHCEQLVADTGRRSLGQLLSIGEGRVSVDSRNEFLKDVICAFSGCESVTPGDLSATKKLFHCSMAMEHVYAARNLKYVSEFNIAAMFVAYAVSSSRMVAEMLGRIGPGGSYSVMKQWVGSLSAEPVHAPSGFVKVAFDNEQKLRKNYLTRGGGHVSISIFTNIMGVTFPGTDFKEVEKREDFKSCNWPGASAATIEKQLCIPIVDECPEVKTLLLEYVESRLQGVFVDQQSGRDSVDELVAKMDTEATTIQCPSCKSVYKRSARTCKNPECKVKGCNIRDAIRQEKESESVERLPVKRVRVTRVPSEPIVVRPQTSTSSATSASPKGQVAADVSCSLLEPCFVNPSSLAEVKEVLRHLGKICGLAFYGGVERQWLSVTCDGVPFWLVLRAIHEARAKASDELRSLFGWIFVDRLTVAALKEELRKRGLPLAGTKDVLKQRIHDAVNKPLEKVVSSTKVEAEFDWVVPSAGGLHKEFAVCRGLLDVNWHVTYHAFALSQGYKGDRQLDYVRRGKDHHKTWDDISKWMDGVCDELLVPYVREVGDDCSTEGFFVWCQQFSENKTFSFVLEQLCHYAMGILMHRRGMRHNDVRLAMLGWRMCSPLIHCRNQTKYQAIDISEEVMRARQPEELTTLLDERAYISRQALLRILL